MTDSSEFWQVLQLGPVLQMAAQSLADPTADLYWPGWLWWKLPQLCLLHQIPPQDNHNLQSRLAKKASSNSNPSTIDRARKSEGNDHNQKKIMFSGADSLEAPSWSNNQ